MKTKTTYATQPVAVAWSNLKQKLKKMNCSYT